MFFWLILFFVPLVRSDIDFMDCGSENVIVDKIDIPGCNHAPCRIYKGNRYHFYITPELLGPDIRQIRTQASVMIWGAHIPIPAECDNPCITGVHPLWHGGRSMNLTVEFPVRLLEMPAELYLWVEYKNYGRKEKWFCVTLPIDIH